jgi:dolichol-phosphate mannosyltransferase
MTVSQQNLNDLISVVIPVFNEEAGIAQLQERLAVVREKWRERRVEFVFVNDGSSDATQLVLENTFGNDPQCRIVKHAVNRGIGAAFRTGFSNSQGSIICTIDADCSYGPENLYSLVTALDEQNADIAVASPYHPQGKVEGVPRWRLVLSKGCSLFYRTVAPVRLYTYTSVFRAYRKPVVDAVELRENGFVSAAEVLIRAAEQGFRITEVPMTLHARKIGQTKMKILRTIREHLRLMAKNVFASTSHQADRNTRSTAKLNSRPVPRVSDNLLSEAQKGRS